jgi:hypothetical protein
MMLAVQILVRSLLEVFMTGRGFMTIAIAILVLTAIAFVILILWRRSVDLVCDYRESMRRIRKDFTGKAKFFIGALARKYKLWEQSTEANAVDTFEIVTPPPDKKKVVTVTFLWRRGGSPEIQLTRWRLGEDCASGTYLFPLSELAAVLERAEQWTEDWSTQTVDT